MGIGAGYFAGGMYQGQQDQIANQQRQQLIAIQQAEADRRQTLFSEQQSDSSNAKDASMQNLFASIPDPNAPAPGGQPGQASVPGQTRMPPGAMGGANPQPMPPQSPQAPQPMPPMPPQQGAPQAPQQGGPARPQPPQAGPAGQQMPQVPGQQPMQPAQQPGPQAGPQQPAGSAGMDDPVKQALAQLDQAKQQLNTPVAQKIASDTGVQSAQKALHDYVAELRKEGHDPTQPGGSQPDPVQQARLMQLFQGLSVASATAAGYATEDKKEAGKLGDSYAKVYIAQEHANATLKSAGIRAQGSVDAASIRGPAGGGGAGGGGGTWSSLSDEQKANGEGVMAYMATHGGNQPTRIDKQTQALMPAIRAELQRRGGNFQADAAEAGGTIKADTQALAQNEKVMAKLNPAIDKLDANYKDMLKAAKDLGIPDGLQLGAEFNNWVKTKGGKPEATNYNKWMYDVQNELAQVAAVGGSGQTTDKRIHDAQDVISKAQNWSQLVAGYEQMLKVTQNVKTAQGAESGRLKKAINDAGRKPLSGGNGGGGGASGNVTYKAGDAVPRARLAAAVQSENKGESVEAFAARKGLTVGE